MFDPLFTYSLARPSDDGSSFSVHPLVHVWALRRQDELQQRSNKAHAAHLLSGTFSFSGDHTPAKRMLIPPIHVSVFGTHLTLDAIEDEDPSIISSLDNIGDQCMDYALFSQAFHLRSLVVHWYTIIHGLEHPMTHFSKNLLGVTSMSIGRHELAELEFTTSWNVFWHVQHPATSILLNNMAASFAAQGPSQLGAAIGILENALGGLEELAGVQYPAAHSNIIQNFGVLYDPSISGVVNAESWRFPWMASPVEVLMARQRSLDPAELMTENPYIFSILASMGRMLTMVPDLEYGEVLLRLSLDGRKKTLGPEHPDTLLNMVHLGDAYFIHDRIADAEDLYRQSLIGRERVLGADHSETLRSVTYLSHVLVALGKKDDAEVLLRCTLKRMEDLTGEVQSITNMCVMLGNILEKRDGLQGGPPWEAKVCYMHAALKYMNERFGHLGVKVTVEYR